MNGIARLDQMAKDRKILDHLGRFHISKFRDIPIGQAEIGFQELTPFRSVLKTMDIHVHDSPHHGRHRLSPCRSGMRDSIYCVIKALAEMR